MLPILSPETQDAMLRACVRELGPALWPFLLVDDETDEPRLVTGVRWLHRVGDGATTEVIVVPAEAVAGASTGHLIFRSELTAPSGAAEGTLVLEPFIDGWLARDGAAFLVLPTAVLDGWIADEDFAWREASIGEDSEPQQPAEEFACIVFGTSPADDDAGEDIETAGVFTTCDAEGRLNLAPDEGLLGALVMRIDGPLDALTVVLHGLVSGTDGETLLCTSARRVEADIAATLGGTGADLPS